VVYLSLVIDTAAQTRDPAGSPWVGPTMDRGPASGGGTAGSIQPLSRERSSCSVQ